MEKKNCYTCKYEKTEEPCNACVGHHLWEPKEGEELPKPEECVDWGERGPEMIGPTMDFINRATEDRIARKQLLKFAVIGAKSEIAGAGIHLTDKNLSLVEISKALDTIQTAAWYLGEWEQELAQMESGQAGDA